MIKNRYQIFGISWFRKLYCVLRFFVINFVSILYIIFTILYSYLILRLLIVIIHLFSNPFFLTFIQILSKSLFTHPCHSNACLSAYGLGYNGQPCRLWSYAFFINIASSYFHSFLYIWCIKKNSSHFGVVRIRMNIGHVTPETC